MSDDDILSDEDYNKIAREVKSLKDGGKSEVRVGMDMPRRDDILNRGPREERIELKEKGVPKSEGCVFCKIVKKEVSARVVHETDDFLAFLDIQPKSVGHVVIVSKRHVPELIELDVAEQNSLNDVLREIILRMKNRLGVTGYTVVSSNGISSGQGVAHFSMHVIPTYATGAVELPVLNLIQPHRVPDFVMREASSKLSSPASDEKKKKESSYKGFAVE